MQVIELIQKKRDGGLLSRDELNFLVRSYTDDHIPDYQMAALLMATCIRGMNDEEISWLTDAMIHSGDIITYEANDFPLIDKHSTGGVGDKISIPLAPAVASLGVRVPMIAGRGLGHTGGTLDKLESIKGFRCHLTNFEYKAQVEKVGCVIMGQTENIAPADRKIYALRDVSGTVESIPLIASSIMSKKLAEGIDGLVLDVKFGSGAFMKHLEQAHILAKTMVSIGSHTGKKVTALLTDMNQPVGTMIGNSLEILESIDILRGCGPDDSTHLTIELGAEMLLLADRVNNLEEGRQAIKDSIESGKAFEKFVQMVRAQGGDESYLFEPQKLIIAPRHFIIKAQQTGFVELIDCRSLGLALGILGGGRCKLSDKIDHGVGIEMYLKIGDRVEVNQPICKVYANDKGLEQAIHKIETAIKITEQQVIKQPLFRNRITTN